MMTIDSKTNLTANRLSVLTADDIREILKISNNKAYNLIHSGAFPIIKIGRCYRVPGAPFYEWMEQSYDERT